MPDSFQDRLFAVSNAIKDGTFDPVGLNFTDFSAAVPNFKGATIDKDTPTISGTTLPTADTGAKSTPKSAAGAGESANGVGAFIGSYFMRGVVIILGFVFVAVGLTMFKPNMVQVIK